MCPGARYCASRSWRVGGVRWDLGLVQHRMTSHRRSVKDGVESAHRPESSGAYRKPHDPLSGQSLHRVRRPNRDGQDELRRLVCLDSAQAGQNGGPVATPSSTRMTVLPRSSTSVASHGTPPAAA